MPEVSELDVADRREIFRRMSEREKGPRDPVMREKDYWVCWTLAALEGDESGDELLPGLVFKGGTSLSKVYRAIARFSEDIDLTMPWKTVGITDQDDPRKGTSRTDSRNRLERLTTRAKHFIAAEGLKSIEARVEKRMQRAKNGERWSVKVSPNDPECILFEYPGALDNDDYGAATYVRPQIRLEFGARNEPWPAVMARVEPYVSESLPQGVHAISARVRTLELKRTFWEKATILHAEANRPEQRASYDRKSRHYADLASLLLHKEYKEALFDREMLRQVAEHKAVFFPANWAKYEEAAMGKLRLVPNRESIIELENDYRRMREMYFEEPMIFNQILEILAAAESEFRKGLK